MLMIDDIKSKKTGIDWYLWGQRISLSLVPVATVVLFIVTVIIELSVTGMEPFWRSPVMLWLILMFYGMPVGAAVAVIAWFKPYAGGILAFVAIPVIAGYYLLLFPVVDWLIADRMETFRRLAWLFVPEVFLLVLGGVLGIMWKKKQKQNESFAEDLRDVISG